MPNTFYYQPNAGLNFVIIHRVSILCLTLIGTVFVNDAS